MTSCACPCHVSLQTLSPTCLLELLRFACHVSLFLPHSYISLLLPCIPSFTKPLISILTSPTIAAAAPSALGTTDMSAAVDLQMQLPPGFRFHPTDEELVLHYLCSKCASQFISAPIIAEIDLYKHNPWDLPRLALYGEKEWYFFSPRDRKYPNGSRPNRAAGRGYWKATGADKPIGSPKPVGIKKALVFYSGKAPKGEKTNWIMHEYRLADVDRSARKKNSSLRLDDWVLCRIYNKKGVIEKQPHPANRKMTNAMTSEEDTKPVILTPMPEPSPVMYDDFMYLDVSDSVPRLNPDSSGSDYVLSPEFASAPEVESAPKLAEWDRSALDFQYNYIDPTAPMDMLASQFHGLYQPEPLPEIFPFLSKPF